MLSAGETWRLRLGAIAACGVWALLVFSLLVMVVLMLLHFHLGHFWGHFWGIYFRSLLFMIIALGLIFVAALFSTKCKRCGHRVLTNWKSMNAQTRRCYEAMRDKGEVKPWVYQILSAAKGNGICCLNCGQKYNFRSASISFTSDKS